MVTPFVDPGGNNDSLRGQDDPLTVPDIPNPEPAEVESNRHSIGEPKPAMLRLRNFAVDPSSNASSSNAPSPSVSAPASFPSPWHLAQGQPEPPPQPSNACGRVASFPYAVSKFLRITFVLTATDRHQVANYSILGSTDNLVNLKLFVHADHRPLLPNTDEGWTNVEYSFWPNERSPDALQLVFSGDGQEPYRTVSVALPKEADAMECISTRQIFAVSQKRLVALHRYCVRRYGMALIERGFEEGGATAGGGRVMEVTVDEQKCRVRAEPLFDFMKQVLLYDKRKTVDECGEQFRRKAQRQLGLLFAHARCSDPSIDSSQAIAIEANMYARHSGSLLDYYHATKLSPAAIVQNYDGALPLRSIAPRPPVTVVPPPQRPPTSNVHTVNVNVNGQFARQVAFVSHAGHEQPNPRVPTQIRQVRLPAHQQGVAVPQRMVQSLLPVRQQGGNIFVVRTPQQQQQQQKQQQPYMRTQQQTEMQPQPQPQPQVQPQTQPQQPSQQSRRDQTVEQSLQQSVAPIRITPQMIPPAQQQSVAPIRITPQVIPPAQPQQGSLAQAENAAQSVEGVNRVPPMARELILRRNFGSGFGLKVCLDIQLDVETLVK